MPWGISPITNLKTARPRHACTRVDVFRAAQINFGNLEGVQGQTKTGEYSGVEATGWKG